MNRRKALLMPFRHMKTTKPATISASKNDNAQGPACSAATTPGNVKLQLIQSYQHLMQENLERNVRFK